MAIFISVLIFTAVIVLIVFILKLTITVGVKQVNLNIEGEVTFSLLNGLIHYTVKIPDIHLDDDSASLIYEEFGEGTGPETAKKDTFTFPDFLKDMRLFQQLLEDVAGFYTIVISFLKKISLHELIWSTSVGGGDAAKSGQLAGMIWTGKGIVLSPLLHLLKVKANPELEVVPLFNELSLTTEIKCMVSFRIGYAIQGGFKVLKQRRKGRKLREAYLIHE